MNALNASVFPLQPEEVYTIRPWLGHFNGSGINFARSVASGAFDWTEKLLQTTRPDLRPLDYAHLQNPVPARVYYEARSEDCWGTQTHCGTITEDTYRPQLVFKNKVWANLIPEAFECFRPAIVDPPVALLPAYPTGPHAPAITTLPPPSVSPQTPTARPANQALEPWPSPTTASGNGGHSTGEDPGERERTGRPGKGQSNFNQDGLPFDPTRPVKIGTGILSGSYASGSLVAAYIGTSSLQYGQPVVFDGRVVSIGQSGVFVDGTVVLPATPGTRGSGFFGIGTDQKTTSRRTNDEATSDSFGKNSNGSYFSNSSHTLGPPASFVLLAGVLLGILAL
jgi:hypothetical protein